MLNFVKELDKFLSSTWSRLRFNTVSFNSAHVFFIYGSLPVALNTVKCVTQNVTFFPSMQPSAHGTASHKCRCKNLNYVLSLCWKSCWKFEKEQMIKLDQSLFLWPLEPRDSSCLPHTQLIQTSEMSKHTHFMKILADFQNFSNRVRYI